jgi:ADP-heptose:LPS heptosyltransferase
MHAATAIISDKQLGDITLLEPMCRLLASRDGSPCALFVKPGFRPLIELMSGAVWGHGHQNKFEQSWTTSWSSRAVIQSWRIPSRKKILLVNQPSRVRWWYKLAFDQVLINPQSYEYWAHYFWRVAGGLVEDFHPPQLLNPPDAWRHPDLPEGAYCLINPTAAWQNKFWLAGSWIEFIEGGGLPDSLPIVLTGGSSEFEKQHCEAIVKGCGRPLISLAGLTDMRQFLHALSRAVHVTCVDGSASHLAQAFGVPVVTLFGPSYHSLWHWPSPRHLRVSALEKETAEQAPMSAITVDRVISTARKLWP